MTTMNVTDNKSIKGVMTRLLLMLSLMTMGVTPLYCDGGLVTKTTDAMSTVYGSIYEVGTKLFPIVIIAIIIALFVTHDERAIKAEIKSLIICVILYAVLLIMGNDSQTAGQFIDDTLNEDVGVGG